MKVRASPIDNFTTKDGAPFDLYLRYLACEPRDGLKYEFFQDEDQITGADVQPGASSDAQLAPESGIQPGTSSDAPLAQASDAQPGALPDTQLLPSPNVRRVPPAKYEEGALVASDKENRPPADDNPSSEDS